VGKCENLGEKWGKVGKEISGGGEKVEI